MRIPPRRAVIKWQLPTWLDSYTGNIRNFLSLPGGGALAGSFTANGTTTTWVPLIDASGSTIALVNAASTQSQPATTYTYDPSGTPTQSGTQNSFWPFLYHGVEQEFIDAPYYYTGSGQFYSPQLVRSLSEVGQTSSSGPGGGPSGTALTLPSGSSDGLSPQSVLNDSQQALQVGNDIYQSFNVLRPFLGKEASDALAGYALPLAIIGGGIDFLVNFFEDIFGGGSSPEIPRQLLHGRHPLYPDLVGAPDGLIPDEASAVRITHQVRATGNGDNQLPAAGNSNSGYSFSRSFGNQVLSSGVGAVAGAGASYAGYSFLASTGIGFGAAVLFGLGLDFIESHPLPNNILEPLANYGAEGPRQPLARQANNIRESMGLP